ncbi:hypothetical protein [Streptomyces sp. NBC_00286]|nr:hypothetical protein [Streptomyces sp. NBC_00286]
MAQSLDDIRGESVAYQSTMPSGPKVTKGSSAPVIRSRTASADRALRTPT